MPVGCSFVLNNHDNAGSFLLDSSDKIFLQGDTDEVLQQIVKKLGSAEHFNKISQVEEENV